VVTTPDNSVLVDDDGHVRYLTLNRPEKLNALDGAMFRRVFDLVDAAMADRTVHVVVLRGAGRSFSSGADLTPDDDSDDGHDTSDIVADMVNTRARIEDWMHLWSAPKPTIAAVHGHCLGSAMELIGACDFVICADDAKIGMLEVRRFALPPTLGFLPLRVGVMKTKEILMCGRMYSGPEAVAMGLALETIPTEQLAARTKELADSLASMSPDIAALVKRSVNDWAETMGIHEAVQAGAQYHAMYHQVSEYATLRQAADRDGLKASIGET
jgi:enoyl-CoA hydratase